MGFNWNYFLFRTEIQINQINSSSFEHRLHRLKRFFRLHSWLTSVLSVKSVVYKKFTDNLLSMKQLAVKFLHFFPLFLFYICNFYYFCNSYGQGHKKEISKVSEIGARTFREHSGGIYARSWQTPHFPSRQGCGSRKRIPSRSGGILRGFVRPWYLYSFSGKNTFWG